MKQVPENLNARIGEFYDASTPLWLDTWGEHMHHGHYGVDGKTHKGDLEAQLDLMEELLAVAEPEHPLRILDAGCGVGGSARYLARRFGAEVVGLTLSGVQAERGNAYTREAGLEDRVTLRAADMMTFEDPAGFDMIWSLESAEHLPDKRGLLAHFYEQLRPGGTLAMVTWCHRETPPPLRKSEQNLLAKLCELYHLPPWISVGEYVDIAAELGYTDIKREDWSEAVTPFWRAVLRSALSWDSMRGLVRGGPATIKGAWAMRYMMEGFKRGTIRYGVLAARKPW